MKTKVRLSGMPPARSAKPLAASKGFDFDSFMIEPAHEQIGRLYRPQITHEFYIADGFQ